MRIRVLKWCEFGSRLRSFFHSSFLSFFFLPSSFPLSSCSSVYLRIDAIYLLNGYARSRCAEYWPQSVKISLSYLFFYLFLEERIQYKFENRFLLQQAVTHPSYKENFGTNPDHIRLTEWKTDFILQKLYWRPLYADCGSVILILLTYFKKSK